MYQKDEIKVNLKDKNAIISGGSSGIGASIAQSLLNSGCKIGIFSRSIDNLHKFKKSQNKDHQNKVFIYEYDATRDDNYQDMFDYFNTKLSNVDILINNVGGGGTWGNKNFERTDFFTWEEVFNKNFKICYKLTMSLLNGMMNSNWGRVITISSIYGKEFGGRPWFNSAKAAQISLMKNLSHYDKATKKNITFNSISPGATFTQSSGWATLKKKNIKKYKSFEKSIPVGKFTDPSDIGKLVLFLCSDFSKSINGTNIIIDGGESVSY